MLNLGLSYTLFDAENTNGSQFSVVVRRKFASVAAILQTGRFQLSISRVVPEFIKNLVVQETPRSPELSSLKFYLWRHMKAIMSVCCEDQKPYSS